MTATPDRRVRFQVANPDAEPSPDFIRALATMLLAYADREMEQERQEQGTEDDQHGAGVVDHEMGQER